MVLTCYCEGYCPKVGTFNGTCEVNDTSYCFSAVELVYDAALETYKELRTFGCLNSVDSGLMQCRGYPSEDAYPKNVSCCRETNLCNQNLVPELLYEEKMAFPLPEYRISTEYLIGICILSIVSLGMTLVVGWFLCKGKIKKYLEYYKKSSKQVCEEFAPSESKGEPDIEEQSSGSGSGLSRLRQVTIGLEIKLIKSIGKGRYGEVLLGERKGELVAVKVFSTEDEISWKKEKEIYEEVRLSHNKNILGFKAADIIGTATGTKMLLVTEYHELGSLYDYLNSNSLDLPSMFQMGFSIISGLFYLHDDIPANTRKAAIVHRDLKSKNILVKNRNGECCIADFGLAVRCYSDHEMDVGRNLKVGTKRYMAPEVLDGTIEMRWIDSFKCTDVYSFSLVLWEICRRCTIKNGKNSMEASEYRLPYFDCVSEDPSFEDMREVVCVRGVRPQIPSQWLQDPVMNKMGRILRECWRSDANARLTALRIKKDFKDLNSGSDRLQLRL